MYTRITVDTGTGDPRVFDSRTHSTHDDLKAGVFTVTDTRTGGTKSYAYSRKEITVTYTPVAE